MILFSYETVTTRSNLMIFSSEFSEMVQMIW